MYEFTDFQPATNERHLQRPDGTYVKYDLCEASEGDVLGFVTQDGAFELTKAQDGPEISALDGWEYAERGKALGVAVRLVLMEHTPEGASFLMPSVVVTPGTEMGMIEAETNPNVIKSYGIIGEIWDRPLTALEKEKITQK